jgi:hypothetical protein
VKGAGADHWATEAPNIHLTTNGVFSIRRAWKNQTLFLCLL